jgi:hypothetical protein
MNEEDLQFLEQCLFDPEMSRNRNVELFEDEHRRHLHRQARILRNLRREMINSDVEYWTEEGEGESIQLRLHRPHLKATRTVILSPAEWSLLNHPSWKQLGLS